ncbi:MAG: 2-amino-4-hydroxy-6-hydroxymethyldihydropteridine diphosphokinase [Marinicella sp.]|nr:2-amino-4-hydroxy-6-hydroxymethyldihydropteridine diphosphokinase [Xanthomonadales bacterium]
MPKQPANIAYLGLGSNLNQPLKQISSSLQHLNNLPNTQITALANFYQSKPWGVEDQPDFINTAIKIETALKPLALLKAIKIIEYRLMRRQINQRWFSRVIDIDILLWNQITFNRENLKIPHPWIADRCFVIQPLAELAPTLPAALQQLITKHQKKHPCLSTLKPLKTPEFIKNQLKLL